MNKYGDRNQKGAQVFYQKDDEKGQELANTIHESLSSMEDKDRPVLSGDYFILKASDAPSALVECGFLSNVDDEKKLAAKEYQDKLAEAIKAGIDRYFTS
jgi:N-acetylmuramoyl-L-alanine amidase